MYLNIFLLYLYRKTEITETKKIGHFAECISQNTKKSGIPRVSSQASLPSAKHVALGKDLKVCRVPELALGKLSNLCRVPRV